MNDVAREAGVGLKTVSRYVNGQTNIDRALVERIQRAIETLGYRRNLAAASIRPGWTSRTVGLIIGDLGNPYYSALATAAERILNESGYLLSIASSDEDGQRHDRLVDRLLDQRVDGAIIVPPKRPGRDWADVAPPVPPIVFADRVPGSSPGYSVIADNLGGARAATEALLNAGARRVAFIGDSLEISTMRERLAGHHQALRAAGITGDDSLVAASAHTSEDATRIATDLLDSSGVDAIFAANNRASLGVLTAFRQLGRRAPLIGFDDFEAASLLSPPLSVVSHDIALMGATSAQILLDLIHGNPPLERVRVLPTTLVLRGSERV